MPLTPHSPSTAGPLSGAARRDPTPWQMTAVPGGADLAAAEAFCREVARRHYENFTVATRLVPRRLRQHLANVYAYARWSDDLSDEAASPAAALAGLQDWRKGLEACFAGRPSHPVFVALADSVRSTGLPMQPFADLLDAFAEDADFDARKVAVRYADRAALHAYCRRSADPVGRIVLGLEGCREEPLLELSDAICTGLQLVNFWQDVKRDRLAGRVYLPQADMNRFGVTEGMLDGDRAPSELRALLRDEVGWARACFAQGAPLMTLAPRVLRPAIRMFVGGGNALADSIERAGFNTLSRRPTVNRWQKARLAAGAWWGVAANAMLGYS